MAINRYDASDMNKLKSSLDRITGEGKLFGSVSMENDVITCTDARNNEVFSITNNNGQYSYKVNTNNSGYISLGFESSSYPLTPMWMYEVGSGAAIHIKHQSGLGVIFITKVSVGESLVCVALPDLMAANLAPTGCKIGYVSNDPDDNCIRTVRGTTRSEGNHAHMTVIALTNPDTGNDVYAKNLYGIYTSQYNIPDGVFEIVANGQVMLTNGVLALADDSTTGS